MPLRAHDFLEGIPLEDAWLIRLRGGGPEHGLRTLDAFFEGDGPTNANGIVAFLFRLRYFLGRIFGWQDETTKAAPPDSFLHRITDRDREASRREPGSFQGPFRLIYDFENESMGEIINKTVHAFMVTTLVPAEDFEGYNAYWAIYVREGGAFTRFYMWLIKPFREYLVYPAMIKKLERYWRQTVSDSSTHSPGSPK